MGEGYYFHRGMRDGAAGHYDLPPIDSDEDRSAYASGYAAGQALRESVKDTRKPNGKLSELIASPGGAVIVTSLVLLFSVLALTIIDVFTPDYIDPARYVAALEGQGVPERPQGGGAGAPSADEETRRAGEGRDSLQTEPPTARLNGDERIVKVHQFNSRANPGFAQFAASYVEADDRPLDPDALVQRAQNYLQNMECSPEPPEITCTASGDEGLGWRLSWPLSPVRGADGDLLVVASRLDLERPEFANGGVAAAGSGGGYTGVARVCWEVEQSEDEREDECGPKEMRVAFNLTSPSGLSRFPSLFRTIGYDWVRRDEFPTTPYDAETFALVALYKITEMIAGNEGDNGNNSVPDILDEGDGALAAGEETLFSAEGLETWRARQVSGNGYRVGNRSDYQLGMSRGVCALAHGGTQSVSVDPEAFTPDLPSMPRSIRLEDGRSVPCAMFINWRIQQLSDAARDEIFDPERGFPDGFFSGNVRYVVPEGEFDAQIRQRALALRGTAMALHMLGFRTEFSSTDGRVVGQWPRDEFTEQP